MIDSATIQALHLLPNEVLRSLIAHAAGIHAARDGDGGQAMASALRRVADRLEGKPRERAA